MAYDWPGNVRELENAIESAVALGSDYTLTVDHLASVFPNAALAHGVPNSGGILPLAEIERRHIMKALQATQGRKVAAAHLLRIGKTTIYRKLKTSTLRVRDVHSE
jgi:Nif-specific regulatory protein